MRLLRTLITALVSCKILQFSSNLLFTSWRIQFCPQERGVSWRLLHTAAAVLLFVICGMNGEQFLEPLCHGVIWSNLLALRCCWVLLWSYQTFQYDSAWRLPTPSTRATAVGNCWVAIWVSCCAFCFVECRLALL